jgi:hypothetical protein
MSHPSESISAEWYTDCGRDCGGIPEQAHADARALWAVRILWRHAAKHATRHSFGASTSLEGKLHAASSVLVGATGERGGVSRVYGRHGLNEAEGLAAMIAAADALVAEDPTLGEGL